MKKKQSCKSKTWQLPSPCCWIINMFFICPHFGHCIILVEIILCSKTLGNHIRIFCKLQSALCGHPTPPLISLSLSAGHQKGKPGPVTEGGRPPVAMLEPGAGGWRTAHCRPHPVSYVLVKNRLLYYHWALGCSKGGMGGTTIAIQVSDRVCQGYARQNQSCSSYSARTPVPGPGEAEAVLQLASPPMGVLNGE